MAQIQSPETYADGQQVTAARLNNQTNGAIALPGLITDQSNITANTVASGDSVLLYDLSATALREANVSDVLGSNLPVTTSAVTAGANSDIVLTPNNGTIVAGQAYTSGDGLTVTVTSTAHGLVVGQVILVTAAATGYNGTFRVATAATNSFTYVMTTAATPGSSTLSYTKSGSIRNTGNESVAGSLFVTGSAVISGATTISGNTTISGSATVSGALTSSGTANFTGAFQLNGSPAFGLYDVYEETISSFTVSSTVSRPMNAWHDGFTSATFTKPSDEIWMFEVVLTVAPTAVAATVRVDHFIYSSNNANTVIYSNKQGKNIGLVAQTNSASHTSELRWVIKSGTALTSETVKLWYYVNGSADYIHTFGSTAIDAVTGKLYPASILRIYKYKTA